MKCRWCDHCEPLSSERYTGDRKRYVTQENRMRSHIKKEHPCEAETIKVALKRDYLMYVGDMAMDRILINGWDKNNACKNQEKGR